MQLLTLLISLHFGIFYREMEKLRNVSVLKELYRHTSCRVVTYSQLMPHFIVPSGARQRFPVSPFLFNFVTEDFLQKALCDLLDGGIELLPGNRVLT